MNRIVAKDIIEWGQREGYSFEFIGDESVAIDGFSSLINYKENSLTWINLKNPIDEKTLERIECAVVQKGVKQTPYNCFISNESKSLFFAIIKHFFSNGNDKIAERQNTYIGKDVILGLGVIIGCNCVLDGPISIGDNTIIEHNVTLINKVIIGSNCIIHSGTVVGKDGFGYSYDDNHLPHKVPHFGGVEIGDRVEVGANSVIDRGTIDNTIIGDDVKIDSHVIVAHNSNIGSGTLIVGGTTVGGSCSIGQHSYIAPHATIRNKTSIGADSFIGMGVVTNSDIDSFSFLANTNSKPQKNRNYRRFL